MFCEFDKIKDDFMADANRSMVSRRDAYTPIYTAIEEYIHKHNLILSTQNRLRVSAVIGMFTYDIFCHDCVEHATELTNILAELDGYVQLNTILPWRRLVIISRCVPIATVHGLPQIANCNNIASAFEIAVVPGRFRSMLQFASSVELIEVYRRLYSLSTNAEWPDLVDIAATMHDASTYAGGSRNRKSKHKLKPGDGNTINDRDKQKSKKDKKDKTKSKKDKHKSKKDKKDKHRDKQKSKKNKHDIARGPIVHKKNKHDKHRELTTKVLDLLAHYVIYIGETAKAILTNKSPGRVKGICTVPCKVIVSTLRESIGALIAVKKTQADVPYDPRMFRYILTMGKIPIAELYNCATYDPIPVIRSSTYMLGNTYVLMRFALIDLYTCRYLQCAGRLSEDTYAGIVKKLTSELRCFRDVGGAFTTDYVGTYVALSVYTKKHQTKIRRYTPRVYKTQNGEYRSAKFDSRQ